MNVGNAKAADNAGTADLAAVFASRFAGKVAIVTGGASGMGRAQLAASRRKEHRSPSWT